MKKILTLLLAVASLQLSAQIVYTKDTAKTAGDASEFQLTAKSIITNNSTDTAFRFVRVTLNCTMTSAVCDQLFCYKEEDDSMDIIIRPDESFDMKVNFYPDGNEGKCDLLVYMKSLQNPENYDSCFYSVRTNNYTGSIGRFANSKIKLYPNPSTDKFSLETLNKSAFAVKVFDILGNEVLNVSEAYNNEDIDISSLKSGVYVVQVIGEYSSTVRLRKS